MSSEKLSQYEALRLAHQVALGNAILVAIRDLRADNEDHSKSSIDAAVSSLSAINRTISNKVTDVLDVPIGE